MLMRKTLFVVLSMALVLGSCKKENGTVKPSVDQWYYLDASINEEQQESKTTIDDGNFGKEIVWDENDKIAVYTPSSDKYVFVQDGEAGGTETRFKYNGTPDFKGEEVYTAIYPESMVSGSAGELVTSWPSEQTVKYGHPMTVAIPMLASSDIVDNTLEGAQFDCLGGILNLVLKIPETGNEGENTGGYLRKIVISAEEMMSGDFHFVSNEGQNEMVFEQNATNMVTLTFEGGPGEEDKGVFLLPGQEYQTNIMLPKAPDGGYTNWKMAFYDDAEELLYTMQSKKALNIKKATVTPVRLTFAYLHRPGLTYSDPAGTIGVLNGRKAIVVDANGYKFALAMENVGATEANPLGTPFHMDERHTQEDLDMLGLTDGWRLPSAYEWSQLIRINPSCPYEDSYKLHIGSDKSIILPTKRSDSSYSEANYLLLNDYLCARVLTSNGWRSRNEMMIERFYREYTDLYVRPVHALPKFPNKDTQPHILTKDDPVGTEGYVSEEDYIEAVMMELCGRKVAVAKKNIGAENEFEFGTKLNTKLGYQDTSWPNLYLENGWTLPTKAELSDMLGLSMRDYYPSDTPMLLAERPGQRFAAICFGDTHLIIPAEFNGGAFYQTDVYLVAAEFPMFIVPMFAEYKPGFVLDDMDPYPYVGYIQGRMNYPIYARAVYEFENITASSPVGTRGKYNGQECVVAMLNGKKMLITINCAYYSHIGDEDFNNYCFMDQSTMVEYPTYECSWGDGWRIINEDELSTILQHITNDVTEGISRPHDDEHDSRFYWMVGDYKMTFDLWGRCQRDENSKYKNIVDTDKLYIMSSFVDEDVDNPYINWYHSKGIELQKDIQFDRQSNQFRELSTLYFAPGYYELCRYQTYLVHEMPTE